MSFQSIYCSQLLTFLIWSKYVYIYQYVNCIELVISHTLNLGTIRSFFVLRRRLKMVKETNEIPASMKTHFENYRYVNMLLDKITIEILQNKFSSPFQASAFLFKAPITTMSNIRLISTDCRSQLASILLDKNTKCKTK